MPTHSPSHKNEAQTFDSGSVTHKIIDNQDLHFDVLGSMQIRNYFDNLSSVIDNNVFADMFANNWIPSPYSSPYPYIDVGPIVNPQPTINPPNQYVGNGGMIITPGTIPGVGTNGNIGGSIWANPPTNRDYNYALSELRLMRDAMAARVGNEHSIIDLFNDLIVSIEDVQGMNKEQ